MRVVSIRYLHAHTYTKDTDTKIDMKVEHSDRAQRLVAATVQVEVVMHDTFGGHELFAIHNIHFITFFCH